MFFGNTRLRYPISRDFPDDTLLRLSVTPMSSNPKPGITPGSLGAQLGSAVRVLSNPGKQKRLLNGLMAGSRSFLGHLSHVAHVLWLQVTGFIFLCFAVFFGGAFVREYRLYSAGSIGPGKSILALCFTLIFVYFGLNSFWRTRARQ
jgi:hypothetical protein